MARLRDVIEAVAWSRKVARKYDEGFNETQTRYSLIDPVLLSLGWDVADPDLVEAEVEVDFHLGAFTWADYVLYREKSKNKIGVVEAKKYKGLREFGCNSKRPLKDPCFKHFKEDERKQLYSLTRSGFRVSRGRAILTDGIRWEIYDSKFWKWGQGQDWNKKLRDRSFLTSICLIRNQGVVSKTLYKYLQRGSF